MNKCQEFIEIITKEKRIRKKDLREKLNLTDSNINTIFIQANKQGYNIDVVGTKNYKEYIYLGRHNTKRIQTIDDLIEIYKGKEIKKTHLLDIAMNDTKWNAKSVKTIIREIEKAGVKVVGR